MSRRFLALAALLVIAPSLQAQGYHLAESYTLGGTGGWDYLSIDTVGNRMFIARSDRVMVVDLAKGTLLGEIAGLRQAHGVAFAPGTGHAFATSGGDSSVVMFDVRTLQVIKRSPAGDDADAIMYDPGSKRVFSFNGDANTASAFDPVSGDPVGTIALGGKPEFGVALGDGTVFVNIEDKGEIVQIDAKRLTVVRRWSIAPCEDPTGLAIDRAHQRLFSVCRNGLMAVSDLLKGKVVTTAPIGMGVDAARFDPATQLAFASNGEGSISVLREVTPDSLVPVTTVATKRGARTMELDLRTHRVYTASADFGPAPAPTEAQPRPRPQQVPGTFALMVLEP